MVTCGKVHQSEEGGHDAWDGTRDSLLLSSDYAQPALVLASTVVQRGVVICQCPGAVQ
jgi:hypothetical protein